MIKEKSVPNLTNQKSMNKTPIRVLLTLLDKKSSSTSQFFHRKNSFKTFCKLSDINSGKISKLTKDIFEAKCKDLMIGSLKDQEIRFSKYFQAGLSQRQLNLQESNVSTESCSVLSKILPSCELFAFFNFSKNKLGDAGVIKLVSSMVSNQSVVSLDLSSTDITASGSVEIVQIISKFKSLVSLDLSSHQFLYRNWLAGHESLSRLLSIPTLVYLNLSSTGLRNDGLKCLIPGLADNLTLRYLNLSGNKLRGSIFKDFSVSVASSNLDELILSSNEVDDIATEELCNLLSGCYGYSVLTRLSLSSNNIPTSSIYKFFETMIRENYLLHVNLEHNSFSGSLEVVSRFLIDNSRLKSLNLSHCALKLETIHRISEGLIKNTSLEYIALAGNNCKNVGAEYIAEALLVNSTLRKFDLSSNYIKNEGGLALAQALRFNKSVKAVLLNDNEFKDEVANALVDLFTHNFYIQKLNIELNPVNGKFIDDIKGLLERNRNYVNNVAGKTAINLKKFAIEDIPEEGRAENENSRRINEFFSDIEQREKIDEIRIKEVATESIEKIKEIKFDLDKMYSFEDLRKMHKNETNEKKRRLKGMKVDNFKRIEKVYQDLIKQVSNLENKDSQVIGKIKKKLKGKTKLPKFIINSRISSKTPDLVLPEKLAKERQVRSKSPATSKLHI